MRRILAGQAWIAYLLLHQFWIRKSPKKGAICQEITAKPSLLAARWLSHGQLGFAGFFGQMPLVL